MELNLGWEELAHACGARLVLGPGSDRAGSIGTDTRRLQSGQIFWVLKGPNFDAHDFLTRELADLCDGWVVEPGRLDRLAFKPKHAAETPDTLAALQSLAAYHRRRFSIPVTAVTGSNGKTTTKEMLRSILERAGPTCSNPGNFNNHVGVPLSLLELTPKHRYGVFELGASRAGEIRLLSGLARPDVAVLTNIGPAHLEFFHTLEETFKAKTEILENLAPEGIAVINRDDPRLAALEARLGKHCLTYGLNPGARVHWADSHHLIIGRHRMRVNLQSFGALSRLNAAAAAAAALALGLDMESIRQGLEAYHPAAMRLEKRSHPSGCRIILDAYNANPASMRAGIEAFCEEFKGEQLLLVLGDMKELGPESENYHRRLGEWLKGLPLSAVYLAGHDMRFAHEALLGGTFKSRYAPTPDSWIAELRLEPAKGRAIYFKASRSMKFENIIPAL